MQRTADFRNHENADQKVKEVYNLMHTKQTLFSVSQMKHTYCQDMVTTINEKRLWVTYEDLLAAIEEVRDASDPDTKEKQIIHLYQTGEKIKKYLYENDFTKLKNIAVKDLFNAAEWYQLPLRYRIKFNTLLHLLYPQISDWSWFPLIGFLHDIGKVLATKKWGALPQEQVVGDTFVVGAPFSSANIYYQDGFFKNNPDLNKDNPCGIYPKHCGFDKVNMSFGHDEYGFSLLTKNNKILPEEALYIVRYHSFYPWHTPRTGEQGYKKLADEKDWLMLPLLKAFQKCDLYSKHDDLPNEKILCDYYRQLIDKFLDGVKVTEDNKTTLYMKC